MGGIEDWLETLGLSEYSERFAKNDIDPSVLPYLTDQDLEKLGVSLGNRRRMLNAIAIAALGGAQSQAPAPPEAALPRPDNLARYQLSVMLCRLADAPALTAQLGPEEMRAVIRGFQLACGSVIRTYNGFLAKLMGDCLLAFFGYPEAEEDDAERAVRAALEVCVAVEMLETPAGAPLTVQIGIASGSMQVAGALGEDALEEQALLGDIPGMAARLQALADPGSIVISSATRDLIGTVFELRELGHYEVKGLARSRFGPGLSR